MMKQLFFLLAAGGVFGVYDGYRELVLARGSTIEPLEIELSELETGNVPENKHLRIGEHWKVFAGGVFEYEQRQPVYEEPPPTSRVNYLYYPIVSQTSMEAQGETLHGYSVIVRTTRYDTIGDIPADDLKLASSVRGMVANDVQTLNSEERELLRESFTGVNFESLVILDEGRRPTPPTRYFAFVGIGAVELLGGLFGLYMTITDPD